MWVPDIDTRLAPVIEEATRSSESEDRARAAFVLGMLRLEPIDMVAGLQSDPDREVRLFAGIGLGLLRDIRGLHACEAALSDSREWVRYYAVFGLWRMSNPRALAVLRRASFPKNDSFIRKVREAALADKNCEPLLARVAPKGELVALTWEEIRLELCDTCITESDKWFHQGEYDQTIRCQETAIFLDPAYTEGYSLVAWLQWSMGDDPTAIKILNRGTEAVPDSPDTWGALGQHYWMTKRYELALEPLKKAVQLGGDHTVRRPYAFCLEKVGRLAECLAQWEILVKECPDDPAAPLNADRLRQKTAEQKADR